MGGADFNGKMEMKSPQPIAQEGEYLIYVGLDDNSSLSNSLPVELCYTWEQEITCDVIWIPTAAAGGVKVK
jgi:hypothetical protein